MTGGFSPLFNRLLVRYSSFPICQQLDNYCVHLFVSGNNLAGSICGTAESLPVRYSLAFCRSLLLLFSSYSPRDKMNMEQSLFCLLLVSQPYNKAKKWIVPLLIRRLFFCHLRAWLTLWFLNL